MKKLIMGCLALSLAAGMYSCKDKSDTTTTETMTNETEVQESNNSISDTAQVQTANDSNVSGTTSGTMEQVP